jgi:peroxiredoxin
LPSTIEQMYREHKDQGLSVLAINIQESRDDVAKWVREKKTTTTVLLDPDGAVVTQYGVTATPTSFIVTRDGRMVGKALGNKAWTSDRGRAMLRALLAP